MFVIGGMAFSTICKRNKVIGYILGVKVAWGNLLMDVIGGSVIKAIGIYYGTVRAAIHLSDEVLDSLEVFF